MANTTAAVRAALGQALPGLNLRAGEMAALIRKAVIDGWSSSQLLLAVMASKTFKARFPAIRNADGSLRMSPGAYIQRENELRNAMRDFGLQSFHYNQPSDFAGMIAHGIDAQQLTKRLELSQQLLRNNPQIIKEIQRMFPVSAKDAQFGAIGWLLNPAKGTQFFEQAVTAAQIGTAARQAGFNLFPPGGEGGSAADRRQYFLGLAAEGVTAAQANQAFAQAGMDRAQLRTLAARFHTGELSDQQIASALFHPDPEVDATRKSLFAQEAAQFHAGAGFAIQGRGITGLQTTEALDR